jgi:drug/metabolite transporter (DMT)-like permease
VGVAVIGTVLMFVISGIVNHSGNPFSVVGYQMRGVGGYLLLLLSFLCSAFFLIVQKTLLDRKVPPFTVSWWSSTFAAIIAVVISLFFVLDMDGKSVPAIAWVGLFYTSLAYGTLGYLIVAYAARITSPTVVSVYYTPYPVVSMIFLFVFVRETTTWFALFGAVLITIGVIMVGVAKHKENQKEKRRATENLIAEETLGTDDGQLATSPTTTGTTAAAAATSTKKSSSSLIKDNDEEYNGTDHEEELHEIQINDD